MGNSSSDNWRPASPWAPIATPGRSGATRGEAGIRIELVHATHVLSIVARPGRREHLARIVAEQLGAALPAPGRLVPILPRATGEGDRPKDGGGGSRGLDPDPVDCVATSESGEVPARSTAFGGSPARSHGGGCAHDHDGDLVWSGPDHWLAITRDPVPASIRADLESVATLTDQSSARALLHVSGPDVRDALAKGFAIDLHPAVFAPGHTAVTRVAHISVQIWQREAGRYTIAVPRSFASSFWAWLTAASAACGYEVVA